MINASTAVQTAITSPVRSVKARVELYEGSTLVQTFTTSDRLMEFTVERATEESKFFGFGICQKINIHLIDKDRELTITTSNYFKVGFVVGNEVVYPFPYFYVTRTNRDENTNELSVTAYDALYNASKHQVSEIETVSIPNPFTVVDYVDNAVLTLDQDIHAVSFEGMTSTDSSLTDTYTEANYYGTETIRDVFDDVAEATQAIYSLRHREDTTGSYDDLVFVRPSVTGNPNLTITKADYFTLDSSDNRRLAKITHSIGGVDNISASITQTGTTQVIRDNAFWSLLENSEIALRLDAAIAAVGGLTINQFDLEWRGNYLLEPGDKIGIVNKEGETDTSFLLDDTIVYNGGMTGTTSWRYSDEDEELESSPTSLGEALNNAYIRIDRVDREITMVVEQTEEAMVAVEEVQEEMSQVTTSMNNIAVTTDGVVTTVNQTIETINSMGMIIEEVSNSVQQSVTPEQLEIAIQSAMSTNKITEVTTTTGFTFNQDGLTVSSSSNDLTTTVSEDGLTIERNDATLLTVNHEGVNAENLHATTYLIIGQNSRFEDYENKTRTGCFWIGGN